ncbi:fungal-specific transcription factor domain-domain-containing protein [Coniella lustricola]|uniref:Fungal-specific transcription factor domain-domain-containing protein n=1 Tax=Coniella lustricola TaxID=2025994 RepID=A0A2T3A850_9PEZI|nr:fungal-specific transcription factor domain-domain-containing protein [Coniella lustricola]
MQPRATMATPVAVQIQDNGSGSTSTNTPTSNAHTVPSQSADRFVSVANMTPTIATVVFDSSGQGGKAVKRPRPVKSCNSCRQRKLRCDRTCPCSQCLKSNRPCKYATENEAAGSEGSDVETSPRPVKRQHRQQPPYMTDAPAAPLGNSGLGAPNDQSRPAVAAPAIGSSAPTPAPAPSSAAAAAPASVIEQFGARLERLERLVLNNNHNNSSYSSPHQNSSISHVHAHTNLNASQYSNSNHNTNGSPHSLDWDTNRTVYPIQTSVAATPITIRGLSVKGNLRTRFFGQNSTRVLLNLFDEAKDFIFNRSSADEIRDLFVQQNKIYAAVTEEHRRGLAPIAVFTDSLLPVQKRMADILPIKVICDRLLDAYISMSEGLYRVVHVPSFRAEYEVFWQKRQVSDAFLPRLMCMLSLGARFETEKQGLSHDRADGIHAPTACALARAWLDSLRGKQLVDMDTLQCETLLLHARRMMSSQHQESWTQLGFIVRMAMTMGLHRDPDEFPQIKPFYAELRRRLWYTIMDMDLHVALACNLPCSVRQGEYTCRPPNNLDDNDIYPDMPQLPPSKPIDEFTNTQLQAYASRTLPYRIRVSNILSRLDAIRDFQEVLDCGSQLEQLLDDVNHLFPRRNQTLNPTAKFKEWRMRALLDMHVRRPLLALYRPFALSTVECPGHITTSYLKSSMVMLTYMDELDPLMPGFSDVSHMYHIVLKHDIMQAAFSVCYFIQTANEQQQRQTNSTINGQLPSPKMPHHPGELNFSNALDNRMVWSTQGMMRAVQNTLDSFIAMLKDSSCDLKDTVVLSVVLNSVKSGSAEERIKRVTEGLRQIVDVGLAKLSMTAEGLGNVSLSGSTMSLDPYAPQSMLQQQQQFNPAMQFFDDFSSWDMDQWDLASMPIGL